MANILLLQGPNLNLLGRREPHIYGALTLEQVHQGLIQQAQDYGCQLTCWQTNTEAELITRIHQAQDEQVDFILINPAAWTHTSVALRDALLGVKIPFIEIHLSNVHAREPFRHHSYLADIALGVICGLGAQGYQLALMAACRHLGIKTPTDPYFA